MSIVAMLIAYVPLALLRGWVIALLWGWYVADYFGIPHLTVVQAIGVGILASLFTLRAPTQEELDRSWLQDLMYALLFPLLALGFGWLWTFAL